MVQEISVPHPFHVFCEMDGKPQIQPYRNSETTGRGLRPGLNCAVFKQHWLENELPGDLDDARTVVARDCAERTPIRGCWMVDVRVNGIEVCVVECVEHFTT